MCNEYSLHKKNNIFILPLTLSVRNHKIFLIAEIKINFELNEILHEWLLKKHGFHVVNESNIVATFVNV